MLPDDDVLGACKLLREVQREYFEDRAMQDEQQRCVLVGAGEVSDDEESSATRAAARPPAFFPANQ